MQDVVVVDVAMQRNDGVHVSEQLASRDLRPCQQRMIFNMAGRPPRTTGRRSLDAVWIGGPAATSDHRSIQSSNTFMR